MIASKAIADIICKSGKFETGNGTCALRCMDQLGSARSKGCHHAAYVHRDLASEIAMAIPVEYLDHTARLMAALRKIAEADVDGLPMHTPHAMQTIALKALADA